MKVREDNRNIVLLGSVALVCASLALITAAFEPTSSTAQTTSRQTALAGQAPVRIVGVPFVPNTNPSEHE